MHPRTILFVANFFFSVLTALTVYILLPFLSTLMPVTYTGIVVAGGGLVALLFFPLIPRLIARYGVQQLALTFAITEMFVLFVLALSPSALASICLIIVMIALQPFLSYELDLLLEATSAEEGSVGRVRTIFLTAWNMGSLVAPILIGALLAGVNAYHNVFTAAAIALMPFIALLTTRHLQNHIVSTVSPLSETLSCIFKDRDLFAVTCGHQILWFFYVWAPLYVPIYLHSVLGISWNDLGWIFSIMLIPYVLVEYPAGWVADRYLGDKELMFLGFILAGVSLASISFLSPSSSIFLILGVLITSRIGAALVESMTEGHFFRRVSERDINSVSIFRGAWPLAYSIAPLIGSIVLYFSNYQTLFLFTGGFIAIAGVIATFSIKDFR